MTRYPEAKLTKVTVSEAGASVYSASELASQRIPGRWTCRLRGAVSIARRLQDPLAELVRIEPKAIGVGQYQHDVSQVQLAREARRRGRGLRERGGRRREHRLGAAAVAHLRASPTRSRRNIVAFRDEHGPFRSRQQLLKVPRVGERTFQQAAGFLRIMDGDNPLDASAVHPEAYPVVERIVAHTGAARAREMIGKTRGAARR